MTYFGAISLAVMAAAVAAYLGNRFCYQSMGQLAAVTVVPWWEEVCKLGAVAVLPGAPVLTVHLLFGLLEFGYDLARSRNDGFFLGLLTLSGHGLVGGLAALVAGRFRSLWWAYVIASLAHSLYNLAVVRQVLPTLGAGAYVEPDER